MIIIIIILHVVYVLYVADKSEQIGIRVNLLITLKSMRVNKR